MLKTILVFVTVVWSALPLMADAVSDRMVASLHEQGYKIVQMDHTWLGRIWILAQNETIRREIVFIPSTGEILRDYSVTLASLAPKERTGGDKTTDVAGNLEDAPIVAPPQAIDIAPVPPTPQAYGLEFQAPDQVEELPEQAPSAPEAIGDQPK